MNLEKYSRGMGAIGLPGDLSSQSRFIRAAFVKMNSVSKEEEKETPLTDKDRILQMLEICSNMEDEGIKDKIVNVFQKSLKLLER